MDEYTFIVEPLSDDDGGGFFVTHPDLPGCQADGDTVEEAFANARDALNAWMSVQKERGVDIPRPGEARQHAEQVIAEMRETIEDQAADIERLRAEIVSLKAGKRRVSQWTAITNHRRPPPINPLLAG